MKNCKVYKGLDTPCKIKGLYSKYFYMMFVAALGAVMFLCMSLSSLLRGSSLFGFVLELLLEIGALCVLYAILYKRFNLPKRQEDYRILTISNRWLFNTLNLKNE